MKKELTILEAKYEAQRLAFAPYYFQVMVTLRETGILDFISKKRKGVSVNTIMEEFNISEYGIRTLLEASESANVIEFIDDHHVKLTKVGFMINSDKMTEVNINFMNDVCYDGAKSLTESIKNGKPEGLKGFGTWPTVYAGLKDLPADIRKSWFEFDHFYSDDAFPYALPIVFKEKPDLIFDIGGNTGKWSLACCEYNEDVRIKILDLPGQIATAKINTRGSKHADRISYHPTDILDASERIPKGADLIWMSQFLDCFSETEIVSILKNLYQAIDENTPVFILEAFVDNQKYEAAKYTLTATSLYFTTIANGNSKMYRINHMKELAISAGFDIVDEHPLIGHSYHTILKLTKN